MDRNETRPLTQTEQLAAALGTAGRFLFHQRNGHIGRGQMRILSILAESGQITQRQLQERLNIQPGSVSEILSKLENKGLITREKDEADRRRTLLKITPQGLAVQQKHCDVTADASLFTALTEQEQQQLLALLMKLTADWHGRYLEAREAHRLEKQAEDAE